MQVLSKSETGTELSIVMPPATYYLGDPCHVLADEMYDELLEIKWGDREKDDTVFLETDQGVLLVWDTQQGDGSFCFSSDLPGTKNPAMGCAVDSGQLALIDVRILDQHKSGEWTEFAGEVTFPKPTPIHVSAHGDLHTDEPGVLDVQISDEIDPRSMIRKDRGQSRI